MVTRISKVLDSIRTNEVISKEGDKWVVKSKSGKVLGRHDSEKDAKAQLAAVEISKHTGESKDLTQPAMKMQDLVVDYVQELADYAGAELKLDDSLFDNNTLYLIFKPDDMITMGDYSGDDLVDDIKKKLLKGKHHVMINHDEGEGFQLQIQMGK